MRKNHSIFPYIIIVMFDFATNDNISAAAQLKYPVQ